MLTGFVMTDMHIKVKQNSIVWYFDNFDFKTYNDILTVHFFNSPG